MKCSDKGNQHPSFGDTAPQARRNGRRNDRSAVPPEPAVRNSPAANLDATQDSEQTIRVRDGTDELKNELISAAQRRPASALSPVSQRCHVSEADLGWAAGVMDGEGCIHIARQTYGGSGRRPTYRLRLQIAQNDELMLREFSWAVGIQGRLYSPKPSRKQNRTCHSLIYDGVSAFTVLERLHKHLRRKQAQSTLAAEFRQHCDIHRHTGPRGCSESIWQLREWYYERMSGLKRS